MEYTLVFGGRTFLLPFVDEIPFDPADDAALLHAIESAGKVREAVVCWEEKKTADTETVIDGAHRLIHAAQLGLEEVPIRHESCPDEAAALQLCHELNDDRRQQDRSAITKSRHARVERVATARREGKSIRSIADTEGVSIPQVQRDIEDATVPGGDTVEPKSGKVEGRDGKTRTATPKKPKPPPVMCDRCQRIGTPGRGCKGCEDAREEAKQQGKKPARKPPPTENEPSPPAERPTLDPFGLTIPRKLADVFAPEHEAKREDSLSHLRRLVLLVNEYANSPAGAYAAAELTRKEASDGTVSFRHEGLTELRRILEQMAPHSSVCPYCNHEGKVKKDCGLCHGLGWAPARAFAKNGGAPADYIEELETLKGGNA